MLHWDLSGLKSLGAKTTPNHVVATLASAVEALEESHLQGTREVDRVQPVTTVREAFGESNTRRLSALCQVGDNEDFPAFYQAWAGKRKNGCIQHILQDHLDSCVTVLDYKAPFATTAALKLFQNLGFSGTDDNNISNGLLPSVFIQRHESATRMKQQLEAINQVDTYDDLMTMSGNLLFLADSKTLSKSVVFIPVTWRQAILQIMGHLPVLEALLGVEHPLMLSYQQGLDYVQDHQESRHLWRSLLPGA